MNQETKAIVKRAAVGFVVDVAVFLLMAWLIKLIMFASIEKAMLAGGVSGWLAVAVEVAVCGLLLMQAPSLSAALSLVPLNKGKIK
jgi:hypothetical protein